VLDWSAAATAAAPPLPDLAASLSSAHLLPDAPAPVAAVADALQTLHATTGLPWWATLPLAAVAVRAALSPLALASARAAAAAGPLLREARSLAAAEAVRVGDGASTTTMTPPAGDDGSGASPAPPPPPPPPSAVLAAFTRLRAAAAAPHPAWIVAAPLAQLPVLAAAVLGVRAMATGDWPGLAEGGALWFPDLTARAVEVGSGAVASGAAPAPVLNPSSATLVAPLGPAGAALPAAVAGTLLASAAVGPGRAASGGLGLARHLRLAVEWCALPAFLAASALPQGAALYWAASSGAAVLQGLALQSEAGRALVTRGAGLSPAAAAARLAAAGGGAGRATQQGIPTPTLHLDPAAAGPAVPHLVAAATARAAGDAAGALAAATAATAAAPADPRAWFALGQLRAGRRDWGGAGEALGRAVSLLEDAQSPSTPGLDSPAARAALAARAHMAAGVVAAMEGEVGAAAGSFQAAAAAARAGEGVGDDGPLIAAAVTARATGKAMPPAAALVARAHLARAAALAETGQVVEALAAARAGAAIEPAAQATHVRGLEERVGKEGAL